MFVKLFRRICDFAGVAIVLMCAGCIFDNPVKIKVEGGDPVRFIFLNGEYLNLLYVYRIPTELLSKGIPGERLRHDDPDMMWWIEGKRRKDEPITYGIVPDDMREITEARPLIEGGHYLVQGFSTGSGGTIGTRFIIQNGRVVLPQT